MIAKEFDQDTVTISHKVDLTVSDISVPVTSTAAQSVYFSGTYGWEVVYGVYVVLGVFKDCIFVTIRKEDEND